MFLDLFNLSTYLIPRDYIPPLSHKMKRSLSILQDDDSIQEYLKQMSLGNGSSSSPSVMPGLLSHHHEEDEGGEEGHETSDGDRDGVRSNGVNVANGVNGKEEVKTKGCPAFNGDVREKEPKQTFFIE